MRLPTRTRRFTAAALGAALVASLGLASATTSTAVPSPKAWFSLDSTFDGGVNDTTRLGADLYAAGWFTEVNGEPSEGFARYDGTSWSAIPTGPGFEADSLTTWNGDLVAGGAFYYFDANDNSPGGVASWDGESWTDLTGDLPDGTDITSLVVAGGDLYAFGFTYVDPQSPSLRNCFAARMTGVAPDILWDSIGRITGSDCMVNDAVLSRSGDQIYVVGDFVDVENFTAYGVAAYDIGGGTWSGFADGVDFDGGNGQGSPYAVVEGYSDGSLFVAGTFTGPNGDVALASYDTEAGWTLFEGFTGDDGIAGTELAWDGPDLYVGGYFEAIDDVTMNGIARFDGTTFHALGDGVTYADGTYAEADTIAPYDGTVFAFGEYEVAGSVDAMGVAYYGDAVVPGAPRAVKATAGATSAKISWTAPLSDGGAAITSYRVTAAPGGRTCTATAPTRTCTVTGLTPGTAYRFSVKATNAVGTGPASAASAAVTIPRASSATYRTITTRVLFYPGDSRLGPKGAATLAALKARIPASAKVTWVKVTGYVQGTTSRFSTNDASLALARAKSSASWLTRHGVGGGYTVGSGGVSGDSGLDRAAVVAIRYVVPAA